MAQHPMEIILLRQWASYVNTSIYITDDEGNVIYYNRTAAEGLGVQFEDAADIPADRLAEQFVTTGLDGNPIPNDELPLIVALTQRVPSHQSMKVKLPDDSWTRAEVTALPIVGESGRLLGAAVFSWQVEEE